MIILSTIVPIFAVIGLGWLARRRGFLPESFFGPANRLVFYIAIPAMVFRSIAKGSFQTDFQPILLGLTLGAVAGYYLAVWGLTWLAGLARRRRGSFIQCSFHGNLGYIGLAVCYYYLGDAGFAKASILTGFLMILQNVLSVLALQAHANQNPGEGIARRSIPRSILGNPVILSSLSGILFSLSGLPLPVVAERTLGIVSGMALPLALLLIGASLSFDLLRARWRETLWISLLKLTVLPSVGFLCYRLAGPAAGDWPAGLILLASPTATVAYVMAREMGGDPDLTVAAISATTLFSAATFALWLAMVHPH